MNTITHFRIKKMSPQFVVTNIETSIEFYTNQLGFDIDFRYEDFYAGIIKNGWSIHLKTGETSVEERKNKRSNEGLNIIFSVDEIEKIYEEMLSKPVELIQPLRNMPYGKEFYIADPDGHTIAFVEEVST